MIKYLYDSALRVAKVLPYGITTLSVPMLMNRICTKNTIDLIERLQFTPRHLVDVGANNSQWSKWLHKKWPRMCIDSFEPIERFKPIAKNGGAVWRYALGDKSETLLLSYSSNNGCIQPNRGTVVMPDWEEFVEVRRFDSFAAFPILQPAILKVDCEAWTAKALKGFGERIKEFNLVVIEMWNKMPPPDEHQSRQQGEIWEFMLQHGFRGSEVVSVADTSCGPLLYDIAFYK